MEEIEQMRLQGEDNKDKNPQGWVKTIIMTRGERSFVKKDMSLFEGTAHRLLSFPHLLAAELLRLLTVELHTLGTLSVQSQKKKLKT